MMRLRLLLVLFLLVLPLAGQITNPPGSSGSGTVGNCATASSLAKYTAATTTGCSDITDSAGVVTVSSPGVNGSIGLSGATSGTASCTAPAVAGTATNPITCTNVLTVTGSGGQTLTIGNAAQVNASNIISSGNLDFAANGVERLQLTGGFVNVNNKICDFNTNNNCFDVGVGTNGLLLVSGSANPVIKATNNVAILTADFTDANAAGLQVITGLAITLPSSAQKYAFHCSISYSQATPIASDQFGVASLTTAPTNLKAQAHVITTEGATAVQTTGNSGNITTTTPTAIVTFTPVGAGEKPVELDGSIEAAGGGASTLQFYVANGTAADVIVIKRDSYCQAF